MAWFDEPGRYYRDVDGRAPLSQGDIVVAPTLAIGLGIADSDIVGPSELGAERHVTLWHAAGAHVAAAPALAARVTWGLAMVLPHSCAMEKEWNERIAELIQAGMSEREAQEVATADRALDQYVTIAPIFVYGDMVDRKARSIAEGNRLGAFPVCANGDVPSTYVDFNRMTTVHFEVIPPEARVRALSDLALAHLQHRLVAYFAFRSLSNIRDIEEAIGRKIERVTCTPTAKRLNVLLVLDDGSTLALEGNREPAAAPGPERPARQR
jgi:hypothetical protein